MTVASSETGAGRRPKRLRRPPSPPTRRDLAAALDDLLASRPVAVPCAEAVGCRIGRIRRPMEGSEITYAKPIAGILRDRCVACHRPGEIAPFALTSYKEAAGWAETIGEVVRDDRTPPWHASLHRSLNAGSHEYKFVLDGKNWRQDPGNPRQAGYYNNSVLVLGETP